MDTNEQDYENHGTEGSGFVTGLFIGAILGAAAALLYAPASGETTRQQLKDMADQNKENLKNQWRNTQEKTAAVVDTIHGKMDSAAERASQAVDKYAEQAIDKVITVSEDAKHAVDKLRRHNPETGQA